LTIVSLCNWYCSELLRPRRRASRSLWPISRAASSLFPLAVQMAEKQVALNKGFRKKLGCDYSHILLLLARMFTTAPQIWSEWSKASPIRQSSCKGKKKWCKSYRKYNDDLIWDGWNTLKIHSEAYYIITLLVKQEKTKNRTYKWNINEQKT